MLGAGSYPPLSVLARSAFAPPLLRARGSAFLRRDYRCRPDLRSCNALCVHARGGWERCSGLVEPGEIDVLTKGLRSIRTEVVMKLHLWEIEASIHRPVHDGLVVGQGAVMFGPS